MQMRPLRGATVLRETGETVTAFAAAVVDGIKAQSFGRYAGESYLATRVYSGAASPKLGWSAPDRLLWIARTAQGTPDPEGADAVASTPFTQVIGLLSPPDQVTPPLQGTPIEGAFDVDLQYDPTTKSFRLWWWVLAWTRTGSANTLDQGGGLNPYATNPYDDSAAATFDPANWWVVPLPDLVPGGAGAAIKKVHLHAIGRVVPMGDAAITFAAVPYLVVERPAIAGVWAFDGQECCTTVVRVSGAKSGDFYPGFLQRFDPVARAWTDGPAVYITDANNP